MKTLVFFLFSQYEIGDSLNSPIAISYLLVYGRAGNHSKCGRRHRWRDDNWKRAATRIYGGNRGGLTPLKGQTRRTVACPMSSEMH
jgi:hypothetical protein